MVRWSIILIPISISAVYVYYTSRKKTAKSPHQPLEKLTEDSQLQHDFEIALALVSTNYYTQEQQLQLYGYFKQIKKGNCSTCRPSALDPAGRAKWDAWHKMQGITTEEAMRQYIATAHQEQVFENEESPMKMGTKVSTLAEDDQHEDDWEFMDSIFHHASVGNITALQKNHVTGQEKDDMGRNVLHWACDRGEYSTVVYLLKQSTIDINAQDNDGLTPLSYAICCDHISIAELLLQHGADAFIKSKDNESAYDLAEECLQAYMD